MTFSQLFFFSYAVSSTFTSCISTMTSLYSDLSAFTRSLITLKRLGSTA